MVNSYNLCLDRNIKANECSGCDYCSHSMKDNNLPDAMPVIGLYAAEATTYYQYFQSLFSLENQDKKK
ncbi:MAG TPA: hypothetical protein VJ499_00710 [Flavisolibacter sp.]|nr:hypothetical protein [Flavisolibacter sp.]